MALNSTSVIKLVDLLCEGPIEGIVGNRGGVYVNETPLEVGGQDNYDAKLIRHDLRLGSRGQTKLREGGEGATHQQSVNQEIGKNYEETLNADQMVQSRDYGAGQIVRSITDLDADSFQVLFTIPALFSQARETLAKGQRFSATVNVEIWLQSKGSAYNKVYGKTITGVSTTNYQFQSNRIDLPGVGPWNIKVKKITHNENDFEIKYTNFADIPRDTPLGGTRANRIFWSTLVEHIEFRNRYPYTAAVGMKISTEAFPSLPTRAYLIRGKKVLIPHNAVPDQDGHLVFHGAFNGTLSPTYQYTTCPVCCFYDLLTNKGQYGAGEFVEASNISWTDLYPLCVYANQLVNTPNGKEPRFALNTVIGTAVEAFDLLRDLATVFRGMIYWSSNTIQCTADHGNLDGSNLSPVHLYTNSSVNAGQFTYNGSSLKTRKTAVRVKYADPDNLYKVNWVVTEDHSLISKYGYQVAEILAFGCTSKWQAQRLGRWMLNIGQLDGEIVTFAVGLEGVCVFPGQIFAVQDQLRAGQRLSGRCSDAHLQSQLRVTLDQAIDTIIAGGTYSLTCVLEGGDVETRTITGTDNSGITAIVSPGFTQAPLNGSVWSIASADVALQKFRCVSIEEGDNGLYKILGIQHNDSIYGVTDTAEGDLAFEDVTTFDDPPNTPIDLKVETATINWSFNRTTFEWGRGTNGHSVVYNAEYKVGNGNWNTALTRSNATSWEIDGLNPNTSVTFRVRAVGPLPVEKGSNWMEIVHPVPAIGVEKKPDSATNPNTPNPGLSPTNPPDPQAVTLQVIGNDDIILRWKVPKTSGAPINTLQLKALIRHSTELDSGGKFGVGTWANSTLLTEVHASTQYAVLPLIEGEYLVKFQDLTSGLKSNNAVSSVIDIPDPTPKHQIIIDREDTDSPAFTGIKDNINLSTATGMEGLILNTDANGDFLTSGNYFFANILDLGAKFNIELTRTLKAVGVYPDDLWDTRTEMIDRWSDIDGANPDDCSAQTYFRTADSPVTDDEYLLEDGDTLLMEDGDKFLFEQNIVFGDWIPLEKGNYTGRIFQFRCSLESSSIDQTIVVSQLGYTAKITGRTEASTATISSGAGAKDVTFANAFFDTSTSAPVSVALTANDMVSGDYYEVSNVTNTGFRVHFKNSSDASVSRNFEYQAVGFGKQES